MLPALSCLFDDAYMLHNTCRSWNKKIINVSYTRGSRSRRMWNENRPFDAHSVIYPYIIPIVGDSLDPVAYCGMAAG